MKANPNVNALWSGPETEGRLKGVPTLIVTERTSPEEVGDHAGEFPHIFIEAEYVLKYGFDTVRELQSQGKFISILCKTPEHLGEFDKDEWADVHRVFQVPCPELPDLNPTDSIALVAGEFTTGYVTVETLIRSKPDDYEVDNVIR